MKNIAVIIANGTEEIECLTPVDVLRRTGANVHLISVSGEYPTCSHGVTIKADKLASEVDFSIYNAIVVPGGMPGATNISQDEKVVNGLKAFAKQGKLIASICASPAVVLAKHNLIGNKKATCYPAQEFIDALGENYTGANVQVDENLITANGPKSAMEFSLAICKSLELTPKF